MFPANKLINLPVFAGGTRSNRCCHPAVARHVPPYSRAEDFDARKQPCIPRFDPSVAGHVKLGREDDTLMTGTYLSKRARNRWRTLAAWAMLPLAMFNGRAIAGCGCIGDFESVSQCVNATLTD